MKGLAEFVMRGRWQALLVAVVGAGSVLFCWLSAAVLALVTLRKGSAEGAKILLWALLPALLIAWQAGDSSAVVLLTGSVVLAWVLRATVSLPMALLASLGVGLAGGGLMLAFGQTFLEMVNAEFVEPYLALREQALAEQGSTVTLPRPGPVAIAGAVGSGTALMTVLCLLLARYWQAALYNPGGFGEEFRELRYPISVSLVLVVVILGASSLHVAGSTWAILGLLPLTFAGLGLVHAVAHHRGWRTTALAIFYASWVVLPMQLLMVGLAIADSWLNIRERWAGPQRNGKQVNEPEKQDEKDS
ncbi:MAG: hypothetical protein HRT77_16330 [Halioglobus sp.]|nr:hypothetical protein [Halioglobus sp.]